MKYVYHTYTRFVLRFIRAIIPKGSWVYWYANQSEKRLGLGVLVCKVFHKALGIFALVSCNITIVHTHG